MVKSSPFNEGGSIPGQGTKIPHTQWEINNQNINSRSNIVTNSITTLKMVHMRKKIYIY